MIAAGESTTDLLGGRGAIEVDLSHEALGVGGVGQGLEAGALLGVEGVGVGQVLVAVGVGPAHDLSQEVDVVGRAVLEARDLDLAEHVEHLDQDHAARAGGREGGDALAAVAADDGLANLGPVVPQVAPGQVATRLAGRVHEVLGDPTVVEAGCPALRHGL